MKKISKIYLFVVALFFLSIFFIGIDGVFNVAKADACGNAGGDCHQLTGITCETLGDEFGSVSNGYYKNKITRLDLACAGLGETCCMPIPVTTPAPALNNSYVYDQAKCDSIYGLGYVPNSSGTGCDPVNVVESSENICNNDFSTPACCAANQRYWYNDTCNTDPNGYTEQGCNDGGGYWYLSTCYTSKDDYCGQVEGAGYTWSTLRQRCAGDSSASCLSNNDCAIGINCDNGVCGGNSGGGGTGGGGFPNIPTGSGGGGGLPNGNITPAGPKCGTSGNFQEIGGICFPTNTGLADPEGGIAQIISNIFSWLMGLFTTLAILAFVISGIQYFVASGNEGMAEKAKENATHALIGIIIGLSGFIIIKAIDAALRGTSMIF